MDFLFWGGPVYPSTAQKIQWKRPTFVYSVPLAGASNVDFAVQLTAEGGGSPLRALLARAEAAAQKQGIDFRASSVGSIGLAGFSAAHQLINPILKVPGDRDRVNYVHLADSCFLGAGATKPHEGYADFAAAATDTSSGKMMTVTSHGPRGNIHYYGPDGTEYNLTSGSTCVQLFYDAARQRAGHYGLVEETAAVPDGMPPPTASRRVGNFIWLEYDPQEHGDHANKFAQPMMQRYGAEFMANPGGNWFRTLSTPAKGAVLVAAAIAAAAWYGKQSR